MPFAYLAAATIGSALIGSQASKSAANTQADASKQAQQQLQTNYENLAPNYTPYQQNRIARISWFKCSNTLSDNANVNISAYDKR